MFTTWNNVRFKVKEMWREHVCDMQVRVAATSFFPMDSFSVHIYHVENPWTIVRNVKALSFCYMVLSDGTQAQLCGFNLPMPCRVLVNVRTLVHICHSGMKRVYGYQIYHRLSHMYTVHMWNHSSHYWIVCTPADPETTVACWQMSWADELVLLWAGNSLVAIWSNKRDALVLFRMTK